MKREPVLLFDGGNVPDSVVRECESLQITAVPYVEFLDVPGIPVLMGAYTRTSSAAMDRFAGYIQYLPDSTRPQLPSGMTSIVQSGGFFLSASTGSMIASDPCARFAASVMEKFPALKPQAMMVELALTEACTNALVHGNLELQSELRQTLEGLSEFNRCIKQRAADPAYALRRVVLTAEPAGDGGVIISVCDEGRGFDIEGVLRKPMDPGAKSGRGVALIRKAAAHLAGSDDGRVLRMTFSPNQ